MVTILRVTELQNHPETENVVKEVGRTVNKEKDLGEGMLCPGGTESPGLCHKTPGHCLSTHFSHMAIVWKGLMVLYLTEYA